MLFRAATEHSPLYERKAPGWAHDDAATVLNYSI